MRPSRRDARWKSDLAAGGKAVTAYPSLRGAKLRSNPDFFFQKLDCFASLAMTM
jgi:hypothetical protein